MTASIADPPFLAPEPECRGCALAHWKKGGLGTCLARTGGAREPRWKELGKDGPEINFGRPFTDCWTFEMRKGPIA